MIKNDKWILAFVQRYIIPWYEARVNPCTYDFSWSGWYSKINTDGIYNPVNTWDRDAVKRTWGDPAYGTELVIHPFELYLLDTQEKMEIPPNIMGLLFLKSSIARSGLEHLHAGLFDPGYGWGNPSTGTLEVISFSPYPLRIREGQPLVQMAFFPVAKPKRDYSVTGRYNGSTKPTA